MNTQKGSSSSLNRDVFVVWSKENPKTYTLPTSYGKWVRYIESLLPQLKEEAANYKEDREMVIKGVLADKNNTNELPKVNNTAEEDYITIKNAIADAETWKSYIWVMRLMTNALWVDRDDTNEILDSSMPTKEQTQRMFIEMGEKQFWLKSATPEIALKQIIINKYLWITSKGDQNGMIALMKGYSTSTELLDKLNWWIAVLVEDIGARWVSSKFENDNEMKVLDAMLILKRQLEEKTHQKQTDKKVKDLTEQLFA